MSHAKVEPFDRALKTLEVDCMINGRRRDHGAERAFLEVIASALPAFSSILFALSRSEALDGGEPRLQSDCLAEDIFISAL